ncbi:MAG: hypothetical protein ACHQ2Z_14325 [Elusimicrobiota bacterium]
MASRGPLLAILLALAASAARAEAWTVHSPLIQRKTSRRVAAVALGGLAAAAAFGLWHRQS